MTTDEWPPKRARTREDWQAYWARQRWDRRFRHRRVAPVLRRWRRRLSAPRRWPRQLRWHWQRARRGWASCDTWSLDGYLCRVAGESVAWLREHAHGYPCSCEHGPGDDGIYRAPETCTCRADWNATLGKISGPLLAYETHWDPPGIGGLDWEKRGDEEARIIEAAQDAFRLLGEHLPGLWD